MSAPDWLPEVSRLLGVDVEDWRCSAEHVWTLETCDPHMLWSICPQSRVDVSVGTLDMSLDVDDDIPATVARLLAGLRAVEDDTPVPPAADAALLAAGNRALVDQLRRAMAVTREVRSMLDYWRGVLDKSGAGPEMQSYMGDCLSDFEDAIRPLEVPE